MQSTMGKIKNKYTYVQQYASLIILLLYSLILALLFQSSRLPESLLRHRLQNMMSSSLLACVKVINLNLHFLKVRVPCVCRSMYGLLWIWTIFQFFSLRATSYLHLEICSYAKAPLLPLQWIFIKAKKKLNYDDMMTSEWVSEYVLDILKISFFDDMRFMLWSVSE